MQYVKLEDLVNYMKFEPVYYPEDVQSRIYTPEIIRPGLQMAGYFDWFSFERVQVMGKAEMFYLKTLDIKVKRQRLDKFFSFPIPALVIANDMGADEDIIHYAKKYKRPVFTSNQKTDKLQNVLINFLEEELAEETTIHGVCLEVFGVGVLIKGKSGIGKSETSLELINRGHRLVADDAVIIKKVDNDLKATCPELTQHLMEIRGIGILDIKHLFGVGSIRIEQFVEIVIELEEWDENKEYDRIGINEDFTEILGVKVPTVVIPVRPGRNISAIIEIAAKNYRQKLLGYNPLETYNKRFKSLSI
ncbi:MULTISPECIES: HPr(Ser) kinase/phosphatase [unclassified Sedimentibacter]|uniref:HPr(Ser) kinase/phosphatase n=1 Tax=unclassified Sedimentibacter TaxID=2649220 RepID=UPI0027E0A4EF|nr:HPr(Ser) kinase/phosphatase [Sedimentibacter sp. MB35-C1]WMJ78229.1 HPr(Ser) kinase/phosphatase [Sedimentibacter sp. MB35-C1]